MFARVLGARLRVPLYVKEGFGRGGLEGAVGLLLEALLRAQHRRGVALVGRGGGEELGEPERPLRGQAALLEAAAAAALERLSLCLARPPPPPAAAKETVHPPTRRTAAAAAGTSGVEVAS